ncbi:MAG: GDP-L-fucose synthase [Parvibaculum sp.]|uniref:GDP-L-fucose synthase n=1 Tax=Parvibaculum sp. TaxID=2024848 RepID=UPI0025F2C2DE|nr:GDP-L-fucose synthase [Parvibaculum sp.]MCE9650963.1 GDP-L-fucose synthase [Parvibaculum sp.]
MRNAELYSLAGKRVWVAGHRGMVGSAIVRRLASEHCEVLAAPRNEVDLRRPEQVEAWMVKARPQAVFLAAARVGGIFANDTRPAEFLYDNLMIEANIIECARRLRVEKLLFLGSSCIYPKMAAQPIEEDALLSGALEPTNQWYAIAKIAGIKLAQAYRRQYECDFISAMPTNLYGPGDNFDLMSSHVLPALIAKAHQAKLEKNPVLEIWGTGTPKREFLHVDDAADASVYLMKNYTGEEHVNLGVGADIAIADLASLVCDIVGYQGALQFDIEKPDGTPRKLLDVSRMAELGWRSRISLSDGIADTYKWFLENVAETRLSIYA